MMGKREIGELSLLDIVIFIMVAEMAVFAIEDPSVTLLHSIIPMGLLLIIQRFTAWLSLKSGLFRGWFEGKPSVIVSKGKIDEHEMRKQRYNFNDLMQQLRENGTKSINDVEFAILEPSGKLSIVEKSSKYQQPISEKGYVIPLIVDGKIQDKALKDLRKSKDWLKEMLASKGYHSLESISFCSVDSNDQWYIDIKDETV
ncbi:YetF domain-containing protein [Aquibacillus salsiterrae]